MTIREEKMDLFNVPQGYYLAHCITADFSLGAGLAKKIDQVYNMKEKLDYFYPYLPFTDKDGDSQVGKALLIDNVFNLVTKKRPDKKAKYKRLYATLEDMREKMEHRLITKIAIPKLGCGHDKMEWGRVREIIEEVFEDSDVEILICTL